MGPLVYLILLPLLTRATLKISQIDHNPGIYFEERGKVELFTTQWKLIAYYDLTSFNGALTQAEFYVNEINNLCKQLEGKPNFDLLCSSAVAEVSHLMNDIKLKFSLIQPKHKPRNKRALVNVIGTISKSLFGTMDEDDAKFYDKQIEKLKYNENYLLELVKNQTLIIETTTNMFNKSEITIESQFKAINSKIEDVKDAVDGLVNQTSDQSTILKIESLTSLLTLLIIRYQNTISDILDVLVNAKNGTPHPTIITPDQLKNVLLKIKQELPGDLQLPYLGIENDILPLYEISSMSATIRKEKVIYEFKIPLPFRENFQLYKVIPLPTRLNNKLVFVQPTSKYLIIDYKKENYYNIESEDLNHCKNLNNNFLCEMSHPLFNTNSNNPKCEIQLLQRIQSFPTSCEIKESNVSTVWIQVSQHNTWLFSSLGKYIIDEICQDIVVTHTLEGTAILELTGNCFLKSKDITIRSKIEKSTFVYNSFIPALNISEIKNNYPQHEPKPEVTFIKYSSRDELKLLSKNIQFQKTKELTPFLTIDKHDLHHYTVIYIIFTILLISLCYRRYNTYKLKQEKTKSLGRGNIVQMNKNENETPIFVLSN